MINISQITKDVSTISSALNGKWERKTTTDRENNGDEGATWVILGQIVFLEGNTAKFPYEVLNWHTDGNGGSWGILK